MFLEQRARWTISMACSLPWFKFLALHLWGHPKSTVYATEVSDVQDLQQGIQNGFDMIFCYFSESGNQFRHVMSCTEAQGKNFW